MTQCSFVPGIRVSIDSVAYHLRRKISGEEWQLENCFDGALVPKTESELRELYGDNKLKFLVAGQDDDDLQEIALQEKIAKSFGDYPKALRITAQKRLKYIRASEGAVGEDDLYQRLAKTAKRVGDDMPPSPSSVNRWAKLLKDSSGDIRSLIPRFSRRGNRKARYPEEVVNIAIDELNRLYLSENRYSLRETLSAVRNAIELENKKRPSHKKLPKPGRKLLCNLVKAVDAYDRMRARLGKDAADRHFRAALESGEKISEPLERLEIDHTVLDLIVVHQDTYLPLGRPTLTVGLDRGSRCVQGFDVSFDPPSNVQVLKCIAHAVKPKDYVQTKYPEIENPWSCWGIPQLIVVDNGMEFHSHDLEATALSLLCDLRFGPVAKPWWKGSVEKFFKTISKSLIHTLPGSTFSNPAERGDYKSTKKAVVTLEVLNELIHTWICDVYHQDKHESLLCPPASVWRDLINPVHQKLPSSAEELEVLIASVETRTLFHYGVNLHCMTYNSRELMALFRKKGRIEVTIRWDRNDLGYIYVLDETTGLYLKVPCTWFKYASGVSLWLHNLIRNKAANSDGEDSETKLDAAKARIRAICQRALSSKKLTTRKKAARAEPGLGSDKASSPAKAPVSVPVGQVKSPIWELDGEDDDIPEFSVRD